MATAGMARAPRARRQRVQNMSNRDSAEPESEEGVDAAPVPVDMAARAGLRAHVARDDEFLLERPEELLARLARATGLCAITSAVIFPEHPGLRARFDAKTERYVNARTGKPADCISIRDRKVLYLHRGGEVEPTGVVPFRKADDLLSVLHALEQLERFRGLTGVQVAQADLDLLTEQIRELGGAVQELRAAPPVLRVVAQDVSPDVEPEAPPVEEVEQPSRPAALPSGRELGLDTHIVAAPDRAAPGPRGAGGPVTWRDRVLAALDLERRDAGALLWLTLFAVVSFGTTLHGARAVGIAPELALVATIGLTGFLWTLLVGLAMSHDPVRKHVAELVFASACVYCSFFTYHEGLTRTEAAAASAERVQHAHSDLLATVYTTHAAELAALKLEAAEVERQKKAEITDGATGTGIKGYGPRAKELAAEAGRLAREAATLAGKLAPLEAVVHVDTAAMTPDQVHQLDLQIWAAAPVDWRAPVAPARELYVTADEKRSPILLPFVAVRSGAPEAMAALVLAIIVDGMMILLGSGIERRKRERLIGRVTRAATRVYSEGKNAAASLRAARQQAAAARYLVVDED